jgi:hypothetical protein
LLQVDADYIPEIGFSSRDFGSKYHNLYSTTPYLMQLFFRTPVNGKALSEETEYRSSHKKKDGPTSQQKRKHHITYLAHQVLELLSMVAIDKFDCTV